MPKANHLIVKARKYFPIMQLVCFEFFFLSEELLAGFWVFSQLFCDSRSFKVSEVFRGLSVTQGLSPSLSRLTTNRLKGFFSKHIWICEEISCGSHIRLKNLSDAFDKWRFWYGVFIVGILIYVELM